MPPAAPKETRKIGFLKYSKTIYSGGEQNFHNLNH